MALKLWLGKRNPETEYLFPGLQHKHLGYTQARNIFVKYICAAELQHKGYMIHSLRHTFASELLNAGLRLECLQLLLGHRDIEMTRRYARLTDKSREEEYFRATTLIWTISGEGERNQRPSTVISAASMFFTIT